MNPDERARKIEAWREAERMRDLLEDVYYQRSGQPQKRPARMRRPVIVRELPDYD